MSGYMQPTDGSVYWPNQDESYKNYYEADYSQFQNQSLEFKPLEEFNKHVPNPEFSSIYDPTAYIPQQMADEENEPPLLEELEIYPDRIVQKVLAVLNPFGSHSVTDDADYLTKDSDLGGPISFYLLLAFALFLSGKARFGYIYGITVVSCLLMYSLLNLMAVKNDLFHFTMVASILGYSLIPIVGLSIFGVFISLSGLIGSVLAVLAVGWSSMSAARLFVAMSSDKEQRFLFAYQCALLYGLYVLIIIF